jgi:hypothetical protein
LFGKQRPLSNVHLKSLCFELSLFEMWGFALVT